MSTIEVRSAHEQDKEAVIDVITLAFSMDPMARWAYPHPATYLAAMPETIKAFGGNGFRARQRPHGGRWRGRSDVVAAGHRL